MRLLLSALLRTLVWASIGISAVAVGLGHYAPRGLRCRREAVPRYQWVNGRTSSNMECQPRFLDRETGAIVRGEFPAADTLELASCSPWRDERGQFHVVGRRMTYLRQGKKCFPQEFGLARYTFPEGRLIDRVELDQVPVTEPCWAPGLAPRIIFVAGNGVFYGYAFEGSDGCPLGGADAPDRPREIAWRTTRPGLGLLQIKDLIWPTDPRLGGRLIASLSYQVQIDGRRRFLGPQLWWIELSGDGTAITGAGRIIVPEHGDLAWAVDQDQEERLPSIALTPAGGLTLAYLARMRDQTPWELRVARLESDPATGAPMVRRGGSRGLARGCIATAPAFSTDGRWVYGIVDCEPGIAPIAPRRFPVAGALATSAPGPGRSDPGSPPAPAEQPPRLGRADPAVFDPTRLVDGRTGRNASSTAAAVFVD
jgi:hypothetical protein